MIFRKSIISERLENKLLTLSDSLGRLLHISELVLLSKLSGPGSSKPDLGALLGSLGGFLSKPPASNENVKSE